MRTYHVQFAFFDIFLQTGHFWFDLYCVKPWGYNNGSTDNYNNIISNIKLKLKTTSPLVNAFHFGFFHRTRAIVSINRGAMEKRGSSKNMEGYSFIWINHHVHSAALLFFVCNVFRAFGGVVIWQPVTQ